MCVCEGCMERKNVLRNMIFKECKSNFSQMSMERLEAELMLIFSCQFKAKEIFMKINELLTVVQLVYIEIFYEQLRQ